MVPPNYYKFGHNINILSKCHLNSGGKIIVDPDDKITIDTDDKITVDTDDKITDDKIVEMIDFLLTR